MKKINTLKKIGATIMLFVTAALSALSGVSCAPEELEIIVRVPKITMNFITEDYKSAWAFLEDASEAFMREYKKSVKIRVVEFEADEERRAIGKTFGTKNAADVLFDEFANMASFVHTGNAISLDDVLSQEKLKDLSPVFRKDGTIAGRLYMLPFSATQNVLVYNKELFRICGLEKYFGPDGTISNWTTEECREIFTALAAKLPTGCVSAHMYAKTSMGDAHVMTILRAFGAPLITDKGEFDMTDERVIKSLEWIQEGVSEGRYLSNTHDKTQNDYSSKFKLDQLAVYNFNLSSSNYDKIKAGGFDKYGFANYPGNQCTRFSYGFEIFDNGNKQKTDVAKDFIRYIYGTERWLECSAGNMPASSSVANKFRDKIFLIDAIEKNIAENRVVDFHHNLPNWIGAEDSVRAVFYKEIFNLLRRDVNGKFGLTAEECAQNLQTKLNAAVKRGWETSNPHK